jgi:hypothetical protein
MSLLKNFDKTSRIHRIVFEVRKDRELRLRWKREFEMLAREYGLSDEEIRAVGSAICGRLRCWAFTRSTSTRSFGSRTAKSRSARVSSAASRSCASGCAPRVPT